MASEIQVCSRLNHFAGILDALAIINGEKVLLDFKTSSGIKPDYTIQLAGLTICLEEMGFTPDKCAILHIPKKGEFEYREIKVTADERMDFLAGLAFYKRKNMFLGRNK